MARILWDTNLFIYLFEEHPKFSTRVKSIRASMNSRHDHLFATAMTLGEVLVRPLRVGNFGLHDIYEQFFQSDVLTLLTFDAQAAVHYARIRQDRSIPAPDAIQLACAAAQKIDLFITNDERLSRKAIPGVSFIASLDQAPL